MRILYIIPGRAINDPNTLTEKAALVAAGHDVTVIGPQWKAPTKLGRILRLVSNAPKVAEGIGADAVMCRDLDTLWAGARTKHLTGVPLVYWPHDVYSWMIESDVPRSIYLQTVHHERRLLPYADAIIASNLGIVRWLVEEQAPKANLGLVDGPIPVVMPCRDPQTVCLPPPSPPVLLYAGTLHKNRFTKEMVLAMDEINAELVVMGPKTNDLYDWVQKNAGPNVAFKGFVAPQIVTNFTLRASIIVTMLNPEDKCLRVGLANKVFDAMSVGRAAIGTKGTATGDLIVENQMGLAVDYDMDSYIEGVNTLLKYDLSVLGFNAYNACKERYNWKTEAAKLVKVFETL